MESRRAITGAILAGGKSSRMGRDKALLTLEGKPFIARVAETLQQVLQEVIIVSDRAEDYSFLGLQIVPDVYKDCGPLAGIHSALVHTQADAVLVCSCDMPYLPVEVVKRILMHSSLREVTFASDGKHLHPLLGVYPKAILGYIQAELEGGSRRVIAFLGKVPHRVINVSEFRHQLRDINTVQEYSQLGTDLTRSSALR